MAVIGTAHERIDGRSKRDAAEGVREYTRRFWVQTEYVTDDPALALNAIGIPTIYQTYNTESHTDLFAVCSERTATPQSDNPKIWEIECRYTTIEINIDLTGQADALFDPPDIEFGFESKSRAIYGYPDPQQAYIGGGRPTAASGIVNSAGEPFDPPVEVEVSYPVLTITRNEPIFLPSLAVRFQDAVNADFFWGVNPRCAKIKGISATKQYQNNLYYWKVTYKIVFNRETWDLQILDIGTYYIDASDSNKKKDFLTDPGKTPRIGNLTAVGDDGGDTIHFIYFDEVWRQEQFAVLNLPQLGEINQ